jgi:glycosyltransferase involved in cell wall biosynthesis
MIYSEKEQELERNKNTVYGGYYAFILVRDGEKTINDTLGSLVRQTVTPNKIIVVNDGSADGTEKVINAYIKDYPNIIEIINTYSKKRDYRRLPYLFNLSIERAEKCGYDNECEYHMISGGDMRYSPSYAETILAFMDKNKGVVVCSGDFTKNKSTIPRGGGRFVRNSFFKKYYRKYPTIVGYEAEIIERALTNGYKVKVLHEAKYDHLDALGHSHNFTEFGMSMKALGYHPLYVIGRVIANTFNSDIGFKGSWSMLVSYLSYRPSKSDPYYSVFDDELVHAIRERQKNRIKSILLRRRLSC